jgi:hypothetical protein
MNNPALPNGLGLKRAFRLFVRARTCEKLSAENPAQPIDKFRFGRENPRKSKEIQRSEAGVFSAKQRGAKKIQMTRPDQYDDPRPNWNQPDKIQSVSVFQ